LLPLFIPPPPIGTFQVGPLTLHVYSFTMITAIALAWWWSGRRIVARGGSRDMWDSVAFFAVICGIVGARAYHVITEHAQYFCPGCNPWDALKIWRGGLGVIGSIIGGGLAVLVYCWVKHVRFTAIADSVAPTLLAAQAWGRVGNWFNQEAFGKPTTVPWALEVDPAYRPKGYEQFATFHPTFLYEGIWNLLGIVVLLLVLERWRHFGRGKLLTSYVLWYTFGRFFIELIRIDPVATPDGIRINNLTSAAIFVCAAAVLALQLKFAPGADEYPFGEPVPDDDTDDAGAAAIFFEPNPDDTTPRKRRGRRRLEPSLEAGEDEGPPGATEVTAAAEPLEAVSEDTSSVEEPSEEAAVPPDGAAEVTEEPAQEAEPTPTTRRRWRWPGLFAGVGAEGVSAGSPASAAGGAREAGESPGESADDASAVEETVPVDAAPEEPSAPPDSAAEVAEEPVEAVAEPAPTTRRRWRWPVLFAGAGDEGAPVGAPLPIAGGTPEAGESPAEPAEDASGVSETVPAEATPGEPAAQPDGAVDLTEKAVPRVEEPAAKTWRRWRWPALFAASEGTSAGSPASDGAPEVEAEPAPSVKVVVEPAASVEGAASVEEPAPAEAVAVPSVEDASSQEPVASAADTPAAKDPVPPAPKTQRRRPPPKPPVAAGDDGASPASRESGPAKPQPGPVM